MQIIGAETYLQIKHVVQREPGEITVYTWECPDGYDYTAENANPMDDCVSYSNRVHFTLKNSHPEEGQCSCSGTYRPGAVHFVNLAPGEFSLDGGNDADTADDQIVWQCFGLDEGTVRTSTVNNHHNLSFSIHGGEHIMCHRFHIPHGKSHQ